MKLRIKIDDIWFQAYIWGSLILGCTQGSDWQSVQSRSEESLYETPSNPPWHEPAGSTNSFGGMPVISSAHIVNSQLSNMIIHNSTFTNTDVTNSQITNSNIGGQSTITSQTFYSVLALTWNAFKKEILLKNSILFVLFLNFFRNTCEM